MIAMFPGKFQPPHLGHILTILRVKKEFQKVIICLTTDGPDFMDRNEAACMLHEVFKYPDFDIITIQGRLLDKSKGEIEDIFKGTPFDVIVSGNQEVIDWALKTGFAARFFPRAEGPGFSGTEIRELRRNF